MFFMKITSKELKSFFYGTLLGDAYIHNGTFYCKQVSKDLIDFKAKIIKNNLPDAKVWIKEIEEKIDKKGVHHQKCWVWNVSGSEYIKKLDKLFYPEGKKVIPKGVVSDLTPLGLAMWYADDGTTVLVGYNNTTKSANNRRVQICSDCFTEEEINNAIKEFLELGYHVSTTRRREGCYRLTFSRMERQKLICEIYKYFLQYFQSLLYKMDLGYRNESLKNRRYVLEEYENIYYEISACPLFLDRLKDKEWWYSLDHNNLLIG